MNDQPAPDFAVSSLQPRLRGLSAVFVAASAVLAAVGPAQAEVGAKAGPSGSAASSAVTLQTVAPSASASAAASAAPSGSASDAPPPPPAPPQVTLGEPTLVRGAALPASFAAALSGAKPALEACYRQAIAGEGDLEPSLSLRLRVVAPGSVSATLVNDSAEASATLRGCARDAFAGLTVAKGLAGGFEALVPIAFTRPLTDGDVRPASACASTCEAEVDEALTDAVRLRAQLAAQCFRRGPASGEPKALPGGALQLSVRIAADGSVCGVSTMADPFGRASLTSCLLEVMSAPLDVAPRGCASVVVPFTLKGT